MLHKYLNFLVLVFLLFCTSCLEEIDLQTPKGQVDGLVIRGALLKDEVSSIRVSVSRIFNFDISTLSSFNARSVTLFDEKDNSLVIPSRQDGVHEYFFFGGDPIEVEFGKQYHIRVVTFDGRIYESTPETLMPPPESIGELSTELSSVAFLDDNGKERIRPVAQVSITAPLQLPDREQNARFLWQAERTFRITDENGTICYVTEGIDFNRIHVFDGTTVNGDVVNNFPLSRIPLNFALDESYYYTIYQRSITEGAFEYWDQTRLVTERTGSLFEVPAGRVATNLFNIDDANELPYGYFEAYAQDTIRLYIASDEYETSGSICPAPRGEDGSCNLPLCCFCVFADGSETTRPKFWTE